MLTGSYYQEIVAKLDPTMFAKEKFVLSCGKDWMEKLIEEDEVFYGPLGGAQMASHDNCAFCPRSV